MGLLTTKKDPQLEAARAQVVVGELVCPSCRSPFEASGETLAAVNPPLGIEAHACPRCGSVVSRRRAPGGL